VWCGDWTLKVTFPELFSTTLVRDASVEDHLQLSNGSLQCNVNFVIVAHDWEVEFFTSFLISCIPSK
jgi:hypothetical protein